MDMKILPAKKPETIQQTIKEGLNEMMAFTTNDWSFGQVTAKNHFFFRKR